MNFGNPDGDYAVQDVTIDGNLLTAEPAALSSGGLSYDAAFDHFDYHEVFGLSPLSPAVPTDVDNALAATLLLPAGEPTGSIHETVPNGQAYSVTLYYIEGYNDNNRSWDLSGDLYGHRAGTSALRHVDIGHAEYACHYRWLDRLHGDDDA